VNNPILSIADWLTATHSVAMPGWLWIIAVPVAVVLIMAVGMRILGWALDSECGFWH